MLPPFSLVPHRPSSHDPSNPNHSAALAMDGSPSAPSSSRHQGEPPLPLSFPTVTSLYPGHGSLRSLLPCTWALFWAQAARPGRDGSAARCPVRAVARRPGALAWPTSAASSTSPYAAMAWRAPDPTFGAARGRLLRAFPRSLRAFPRLLRASLGRCARCAHSLCCCTRQVQPGRGHRGSRSARRCSVWEHATAPARPTYAMRSHSAQ